MLDQPVSGSLSPQVLKEKNNVLSQELEASRTKLHATTSELEELRKVTVTSDQKNKLEVERDNQAEEIKSLKAQLSATQKENKNLKGGIFGMTFEPFMGLILSVIQIVIILFFQVC